MSQQYFNILAKLVARTYFTPIQRMQMALIKRALTKVEDIRFQEWIDAQKFADLSPYNQQKVAFLSTLLTHDILTDEGIKQLVPEGFVKKGVLAAVKRVAEGSKNYMKSLRKDGVLTDAGSKRKKQNEQPEAIDLSDPDEEGIQFITIDAEAEDVLGNEGFEDNNEDAGEKKRSENFERIIACDGASEGNKSDSVAQQLTAALAKGFNTKFFKDRRKWKEFSNVCDSIRGKFKAVCETESKKLDKPEYGKPGASTASILIKFPMADNKTAVFHVYVGDCDAIVITTEHFIRLGDNDKDWIKQVDESATFEKNRLFAFPGGLVEPNKVGAVYLRYCIVDTDKLVKCGLGTDGVWDVLYDAKPGGRGQLNDDILAGVKEIFCGARRSAEDTEEIMLALSGLFCVKGDDGLMGVL